LKEKALNRAVWRTRYERGYGPVVRQTTKWWYIIKIGQTAGNFLALMMIMIGWH